MVYEISSEIILFNELMLFFCPFMLYHFQDLALAIAMGVESACQTGFVNVKMVILALIAPLVMCLFIY